MRTATRFATCAGIVLLALGVGSTAWAGCPSSPYAFHPPGCPLQLAPSTPAPQPYTPSYEQPGYEPTWHNQGLPQHTPSLAPPSVEPHPYGPNQRELVTPDAGGYRWQRQQRD